MSNSPDQVFYQDENVTVTKTRIIINGKTYSTANITSVAPYSKSSTGCGCGCLSLGVFFLIGVVNAAMHNFSISGILGWLVFVGICFVMSAIFFMPTYSVEIKSSSSEAERVFSGKKEKVFEIVEAINQAIEARG